MRLQEPSRPTCRHGSRCSYEPGCERVGASEHVERFQKCDMAHCHTPESEQSNNSPQRLNAALLDPVAQCNDALDGVGALAGHIDTAELVAVQTAARVSAAVSVCDMARYHTYSQIRPILPERRHLTLFEAVAQRSDALGGE